MDGGSIIVTTRTGLCVPLEHAPRRQFVYVNKLAMTLVDTPTLGYATAAERAAMGSKVALEAKMHSAVRIRP